MTDLLLSIAPHHLRDDLDRRAFSLTHALAGHPLLRLDRLVELARALPDTDIEYNAGDLPIGVDPGAVRPNGLSVEETIRRIEECGSWMVLKRVQQVPAYGALLDRCLDAVRPRAAYQREAFVFISSPGSVTPFHMDPEVNFLLQIQGTKTMWVWDRSDHVVSSERDREDYFTTDRHRNLAYRDEFAARGRAFELSPGRGVHVPMAAPHWVKNGDAVSVSFSVTFYTDEARARVRLYQINSRLRRLGLAPHPVGSSPRRDRAKLRVFGALGRARSALRSYSPRP